MKVVQFWRLADNFSAERWLGWTRRHIIAVSVVDVQEAVRRVKISCKIIWPWPLIALASGFDPTHHPLRGQPESASRE